MRGGERAGFLGLTRPLATQGVIESFAEAIATDERLQGPSDSPLPPPLPARSRSLVLLVGDFLGEPEETERALKAIAADGAIGEIVIVIDPIEETYPFSGNVEFLHPGGSARFVTPRAQSLRDEYLARLAAHRDALRQISRGSAGAEPAQDRRLRRAKHCLRCACASPRPKSARQIGAPDPVFTLPARLRRPGRSGCSRRPRRALLPPARHAADAAPHVLSAAAAPVGACAEGDRAGEDPVARAGAPSRGGRLDHCRNGPAPVAQPRDGPWIGAFARPDRRRLAGRANLRETDRVCPTSDGRGGAGRTNGRGQGVVGRGP